MKLETFFAKFDQFAAAPDAVEKMRELVLDLAVKGKLTDRDLKKESVGSKYSDEPSSDVLPANWRLLNFGKFCDIQGGNQPPKSQFSDEPRPGYVRMFQIRDLGERPVPVYISKESTNRFCREGEILIGRYGASVGKVFWAQDGAYNVALAKFIFPEDALLPAFAFWVLKSDFFQAEIAGASRSAQAGFNKGDLAAIDFPLPPLAEQKRIVAKVDELMALCDRLEAQQQERETRHAALARASLARFALNPQPSTLNFLFHPSYAIPPADLRKSILTLAVQGKLVPQDPNDEPAEELFARIESTREKLIKERTIKRVSVEANPSGDECESLPPGWLWTRLGNSFDVRDGTHDTPKYTTEGFPLITSKNIYSGSLLFDGANLISEKDHRQISERSRVDRGDILFAMIGSIGNPVIVDTDREFSIKNVALFKYYAAADSEPRFLLLYLKLVAEEMKAKAAGGVQSFVSLGFLRNYLFPLPPLAEQRRIVAKVEQLMALVDALETQLAASRATAANLLSALVAELTTASANGAPHASPGQRPGKTANKSHKG